MSRCSLVVTAMLWFFANLCWPTEILSRMLQVFFLRKMTSGRCSQAVPPAWTRRQTRSIRPIEVCPRAGFQSRSMFVSVVHENIQNRSKHFLFETIGMHTGNGHSFLYARRLLMEKSILHAPLGAGHSTAICNPMVVTPNYCWTWIFFMDILRLTGLLPIGRKLSIIEIKVKPTELWSIRYDEAAKITFGCAMWINRRKP